MKKRMISLVAISCILSAFLWFSGCSSGVSQAEYDEVVSQLNELKEQYGINEGTDENATSQSDEAATDSSDEEYTPTGNFDEKAVLEQLKVTEYSYLSGNSPWEFLVIDNTSEFNVNISVELKTYDSAGNLLAAKNASQEAVEHGAETIISFLLDEPFAKTEYTLSVSEEDQWGCVISDLSYESTAAKEKEILSVTNNGQEPAEFVEAVMLFFNGGKLVDHASNYFTDDDYELKPGETISKEMNCYEPYDSYKVYFLGRR